MGLGVGGGEVWVGGMAVPVGVGLAPQPISRLGTMLATSTINNLLGMDGGNMGLIIPMFDRENRGFVAPGATKPRFISWEYRASGVQTTIFGLSELIRTTLQIFKVKNSQNGLNCSNICARINCIVNIRDIHSHTPIYGVMYGGIIPFFIANCQEESLALPIL